MTDKEFNDLYREFLVENFNGCISNTESWLKLKFPEWDKNDIKSISDRITNKFINDHTYFNTGVSG